jgi:hypothetical protein
LWHQDRDSPSEEFKKYDADKRRVYAIGEPVVFPDRDGTRKEVWIKRRRWTDMGNHEQWEYELESGVDDTYESPEQPSDVVQDRYVLGESLQPDDTKRPWRVRSGPYSFAPIKDHEFYLANLSFQLNDMKISTLAAHPMEPLVARRFDDGDRVVFLPDSTRQDQICQGTILRAEPFIGKWRYWCEIEGGFSIGAISEDLIDRARISRSL